MAMTLRQAREALGWTQQQLARKSGVRQQTISKIENNQNRDITYATVICLMRALQKGGLKGVSADDLFPVACPMAENGK